VAAAVAALTDAVVVVVVAVVDIDVAFTESISFK
jgi:hypothetical protein